MPGGSDYQGPPEVLDAYTNVVNASASGVVVKGAKNPYTSHNGHMFSFLDAEGSMALRLSDELAEEFRLSYESGPVKQYGAVMRGYVWIPEELLADAEAAVSWFNRSFAWIDTLEPKATKK